MKKNRLMSLAAVLLVLTLVTACFVGGTFAKYTSTATGTDTATVAKWDFNVNDIDLSDTDASAQLETEFDLFALPNSNVTQNNGLIAPGTTGSFTFEVANNGEVTANYTIALSAATTNGGAPIQYSLSETDGYTTDISTLDISGTLVAGASGSATVYWKWVSAGDAEDTAFGVAAQSAAGTITITAVATATQVA